MSVPQAWICLWTFGAVALAVAGGTLLAALLLRVRSRKYSEARTRTYECGEEPDGGAWMRFHPRYYLVALVFVIFDVEVAFVFPVAVAFREYVLSGRGLVVFTELFVFVAILFAGLIYVWAKRDLEWLKRVTP